MSRPAEIWRSSAYRTPRRKVETHLVASIIDYLRRIGWYADRRNVGFGQYPDNRARMRMVRFGTSGQSDVWAIAPGGLHVEIEAKKPGSGKASQPRPNQEAWLEKCRTFGAVAVSVTSLEELSASLRSEFDRRGIAWNPSWTI